MIATPALVKSGNDTYQWKRDDGKVILSGVNERTYTVQDADVGYRITVTVTRSGYSDDITSNRTLIVTPRPSPEITIITPTKPESITVTEGNISGILTVKANVTQNKELKYQWYESYRSNNMTNDNDRNVILGARSESFIIPKHLTEGPHYYYCVVTAEGARERRTELVTINVKKR